jgi:hypothetical protein
MRPASSVLRRHHLFRFNADDSVNAEPLQFRMESLFALEDNLLFFTGFSRSAGAYCRNRRCGRKRPMRRCYETALREGARIRSRKALEEGHPGVRRIDARALNTRSADPAR